MNMPQKEIAKLLGEPERITVLEYSGINWHYGYLGQVTFNTNTVV